MFIEAKLTSAEYQYRRYQRMKKPQLSKIQVKAIIHFVTEWLAVCLCFCAEQPHESWHYIANLWLNRTSAKTTHGNIKWAIDKEVQA